ncbi:MAG: DUF3440 domain-containing protein [Anaerolineae bacterium]|nr:DUF3440 domain-containing protein [Anaerolineae bacterium]
MALKKQQVKQDVMTLTLERLHHVYDLFDHVAISFSGGKDSTVVLNLALQVARKRGKLPLRVIFFDEEAIPYQVEHYVRRVGERPGVALEWYCLPVKHRNACSNDTPYWCTWNPHERDLWVRPLPPEALTTLASYHATGMENCKSIPEISGVLFPPETYGRACFLLGIRAGESMTRYRAVTHRLDENYIIQHTGGYGGATDIMGWGNLFKAYPIYDWDTEDVWTAPKLLGWDYCEAYDHMEMTGMTHHQQRIAPPYGEQPSRSLWMYHVCFPELWDKMVNRVPGANTAARYSTTEIYGVGGVPEKPEDVAWEDFINQLLSRYEDTHIQDTVRARIKKLLKAHYRKTADPVLPTVKHPDTGLSWEFLVKIAYRGDTKNRMDPGMRIAAPGTEKYQADYRAYQRALAEQQAALSEGGTRW